MKVRLIAKRRRPRSLVRRTRYNDPDRYDMDEYFVLIKGKYEFCFADIHLT